MKKIYILAVFLISLSIFSQNTLPIIQSNTQKITILEDKLIPTDWYLDPKAQPDIYQTGKIVSQKSIQVYTDMDTLDIVLQPNQTFDYIVILNQKDSCYNRIQGPKYEYNFSKKPKQKELIKFELTPHNNIKIQTVINHKDTLHLHFDTGASDFLLTKAAIQKFLNPNQVPLTMQDISNNTFEMGNLKWQNQQIYPIQITAQNTDGMFGWNIFDGKILEINYDTSLITIHNQSPKIGKEYDKFPIHFVKDYLMIALELEVNQQKQTANYLFDTGFQKAVLLDHDLLADNYIDTSQIKVLKTDVLRNSRNEEIPIKTVEIDQLKIGRYTITNVPCELNNYNKPALHSTHFLGSDIIKRFNIILDFQNYIIYLKPNKNFKKPFFDEAKK